MTGAGFIPKETSNRVNGLRSPFCSPLIENPFGPKVLSERTGEVYGQIARNWPVIAERISQRAADAPFSIRAALGAIKSNRKTNVEGYTLRLDNWARRRPSATC
jgi:hypothetical protein